MLTQKIVSFISLFYIYNISYKQQILSEEKYSDYMNALCMIPHSYRAMAAREADGHKNLITCNL